MSEEAPAIDPIVLRFEDISYAPGATAPGAAPLFSGLSLEIPRGVCTVVMGPSGSGKSTLLRLGAGLIPPDSGRVVYEGNDWHDLTDHENAVLRESMGFAFQNGALWANRSVYQNIELPYEYHRPKASRQEIRDAVAKAAHLAGIQAQLGLRPSQLSLGEQKLISLARALTMDPQVLFLDDPTGGLDAQSTEKLLTLFNNFRQENRTLILVTQDPTVTAMIADRLLIIKAGAVLAHGPFREVTKLPDREVAAILTSVLSQAATFSGDILDLLSIDHDTGDGLK
jgi:phospholipid/cholesterol/gamma-HCH transport system ATP-binding protein